MKTAPVGSEHLTIDISAKKVKVNNVEVSLTPTSFELLCYLSERAPTVVSVDELLANIWRGKVVSRETVKQQIKTLRGQLEGAGDKVESVRGFGYRLAVPEANDEHRDEDIPAEIKHYFPVALAAMLIFVVLIFWFSGEKQSRPDIPLPLVIAVLPFENLSEQPASSKAAIPTTMSRIIQDQLTTELSRQQDVRTLSLSGVDPTYEASKTPADYLEQFKVHMLIEGSLRDNGAGVSANMRVVWTRTGMTAWRDTIDIASYDENVILKEIENILIPFANKKVAWLKRRK